MLKGIFVELLKSTYYTGVCKDKRILLNSPHAPGIEIDGPDIIPIRLDCKDNIIRAVLAFPNEVNAKGSERGAWGGGWITTRSEIFAQEYYTIANYHRILARVDQFTTVPLFDHFDMTA